MTVNIIPRADWGARPPKRRFEIDTPTRELWLHHTVGDYRGVDGMRALQRFHMDERGWSDVAYSFVIEWRTGLIYEARGAGIAGGHTKGHNTHSHAICITGNFDQIKPSDELIGRIAELVRHGYQQGWWPATITGGHRDASGANTACPGRYLHRRIGDINQQATTGNDDMTPEQIQHVKDIQTALNLSGLVDPPLDVDGIPGPLTVAAARLVSGQTLTPELAELARIGEAFTRAVDLVTGD